MKYKEAKTRCHIRSAIYRESIGKRYWKNYSVPLDERVPGEDQLADDWMEYDPRDDDPAMWYDSYLFGKEGARWTD